MLQIISDLKDHMLWMGADETTDAAGRFVLNVVVGKITEENSSPYLVNVIFLERTNAEHVSRAVNETLTKILPDTQPSDIVLLLSDAGAYMLKSGNQLRVFFPNLHQVTSLAHGFHRVCEYVREMFPRVNFLIATVKKVFLKCPARMMAWKDANPDTALPPEPILTRWDTWVPATLYYSENFQKIKTVVDGFDVEEAMAIQKAQEAFEDKQVRNDLTFIAAHFSFFPDLIQKPESQGLTVVKQIGLVNDGIGFVRLVPGDHGAILTKKLEAVLKRNPDLKALEKVAAVLRGDSDVDLPATMSPQMASNLKYAPILASTLNVNFQSRKCPIDVQSTPPHGRKSLKNSDHSLFLFA